METRTRLAIGGMTAVAASVAVICVVALTNSVALSDAEGSPVDASRVVVPSSGIASSGNQPTPRPVETGAPQSGPPQAPPEAVVVPAPAPEIVTPEARSPHSDPAVGAPAVPAAPSDDEALAEAEATGSWASVREWAVKLGWSEERIDAWIARLEEAKGWAPEAEGDRGRGDDDDRFEFGGDDDRFEFGGDSDRRGDRHAEGSGDGDREWADSGSDRRVSAPESTTETKQERSTAIGSSKERPAHADASADHRSEKPGLGAKKDRSRDSPDRRD